MIPVSCPVIVIKPSWCQSTELMDSLNGNKGNDMRRQQQLLSGKHNYNPHSFEVAVRSDCRDAPHLTGDMLSFSTRVSCFLARSKAISLTNLSVSESIWVTKTPSQSCVQKRKSRTLASALRNSNIWASDHLGTGQNRVLYCTREKHHISGAETIRFSNLYWDKQHFHRNKRETSVNCKFKADEWFYALCIIYSKPFWEI